MKLIRSMPGVPSATPAQEKSASTGPPHSSTAESIEDLLGEVEMDRGDPVTRDLGTIHHHHLRSSVE